MCYGERKRRLGRRFEAEVRALSGTLNLCLGSQRKKEAVVSASREDALLDYFIWTKSECLLCGIMAHGCAGIKSK